MAGIKDLLRDGSPWWVHSDLSADAWLVRCVDSKHFINSHGGDVLLGDRIIVLGFMYDFEAANGNGFDLVFGPNEQTSPDTATARVIHGSRATTAITSKSMCVPFCFIPGPCGVYTPISNSASLLVNITATGPTRGSLTVWGVVVDKNYQCGGGPGYGFLGSPVDFGA